MTNGICNQCGAKIRFGINLCKSCLNRKKHCAAILSQNKKKLRKILEVSEFTIEWFDRFLLYTDNIVENGKVLMEYLEVDNRKRLFRIKNITVRK